MTPVVIAGLAFVGTLIAGICVWLAVYAYRKSVQRNQPDFLTVRGMISEKDEKEIPARYIPLLVKSCAFDRE